LWFWNYSAPPHALDVWTRHLSPAERARADRFTFDKDRSRFIICRGRLREILGAELNAPPDEIKFSTIARGKPVVEAAGAASIHFNLSHADELAALAVTDAWPVGVDIERHRDVRDDFIAFALNPAEFEPVLACSGAERTAAFFQAWTAKEAYLKATGFGLGRSLKSFDVRPTIPSETLATDLPTTTIHLGRLDHTANANVSPLPGFAPCHLTRIDAEDDHPSDWQVISYRPLDGYAGALAWKPEPGVDVSVTLRWLHSGAAGNPTGTA